jgi:hypothetical protein
MPESAEVMRMSLKLAKTNNNNNNNNNNNSIKNCHTRNITHHKESATS